MPLVYLIRHGQASFGAEDYDVLSATGHLQGKHVGTELRRRGVRPDQVWSGTLRRQRETALAAGLDAPLQQDPRWNEFDHLGLVRDSGQPSTPGNSSSRWTRLCAAGRAPTAGGSSPKRSTRP